MKNENKSTASGITDSVSPRRLIMATAAELFAEKGYGSVGIAEVGDAAGFGKGALYHHIGSKEALLFDIMTTYMIDLISHAQEILNTVTSPTARIQALSRSFMRIMFSSRSEMTVCFREVHSLGEERRKDVISLHSRYQEVWTGVFVQAHQGGGLEISRTEGKALLGMYFYSFLWVKRSDEASLDAIADAFSGIVLRALGLDGAPRTTRGRRSRA